MTFLRTYLLFFTLILSHLTLNASSINIAVATNVSYATEELKESFSQLYPEITVNIILGSSGKLAAQISHGAPYGLFMSANMLYPQKLFAQDIATTKPRIYTQGLLILFSKNKQDYTQGIKILKNQKIQKISMANPKTAPYGTAAYEALHNAHIYENIQSKLIFAESISQTLSYVFSGADIALVAKSSLYSAKMSMYKERIHWIELDQTLYQPIKQGVVLLKPSKKDEAYKLFYEFLFSDTAQKIFKKYGYQKI